MNAPISRASPLFEAALKAARPLLVEAAEGTLHTVAGIERTLRADKAQLWLGDGCVVVTEVQDYPGGERAIQSLWAGGALEGVLALSPAIEAWGRLVGCKISLVESRAAWVRLLKARGYAPWSVTLRKAL